jgi:hypothetical protein
MKELQYLEKSLPVELCLLDIPYLWEWTLDFVVRNWWLIAWAVTPCCNKLQLSTVSVFSTKSDLYIKCMCVILHSYQTTGRQPVCRPDNLTIFMCRLSWNLGASTSRNPMGLSRPVMGLLYLYLLPNYSNRSTEQRILGSPFCLFTLAFRISTVCADREF